MGLTFLDLVRSNTPVYTVFTRSAERYRNYWSWVQNRCGSLIFWTVNSFYKHVPQRTVTLACQHNMLPVTPTDLIAKAWCLLQNMVLTPITLELKDTANNTGGGVHNPHIPALPTSGFWKGYKPVVLSQNRRVHQVPPPTIAKTWSKGAQQQQTPYRTYSFSLA